MRSSSSSHVPERRLTWDGCLNVRDLGGHPTRDGGLTRFGAVVRADSVRGLSDEGWAALVAYGVGTIIDLRFHSELDADPPRELPVEVVHIALFGEPEHLPAIDDLVRSVADPAKRTQELYLQFLERFRANFAIVVREVARAPEGAVLVHCQAGKDRTGLVCALLLELAGVPREAIAADYAVSGANLAPVLDDWLAEAEDELERERRRMLAACPAEAMVEVLAELDRRYGSVAGYLHVADATDAELERARARLR